MSFLLLLLLSVVPQGVILVKGAAPSASDTTTPVPESGRVTGGRYRNAYFGLTFPIPAGWSEQPAGPPPSEGGSYTLAEFAMKQANLLVTAQDLFFGADPLLVVRRNLPSRIVVEDGPATVQIAGREFHRAAFRSAQTGLRWLILTTEARCHALTFTFTGRDADTLAAGQSALGSLSLAPAAPQCAADYASGANVIEKKDPLLTTHRYNTVPLRIIIGKNGRVSYAHLLSAYPDQAAAILAATKTWRFKPYRAGGKAAAVETGMKFRG